MKKIPLRIRFTVIASLFLLISCSALAIVSNISANKLVDATVVLPSQQSSNTEDLNHLELNSMTFTESATFAADSATHYRIFQIEIILATCIIVLFGSLATYFASGYVLKPIHTLSEEVKKRNINTLDQPLVIPQSADEIQELTVSFNQMLSELQRSFAMQKQFSADAAHELRTPLTVMLTKLDVMALSKDVSADTKALISSLNCQLERLTVLIEDLLLFSKDLPLDFVKPVPLLSLLQDVAYELSDVASQKQIELFIDGRDCIVQGQDCLLERVFYNLIENAIKYSPPGSLVHIRLYHKNTEVCVSVEDQGEGIPEKFQKSIFEPFFRIDKSRSRSIGGNGLGLAVCKKILDRHHAFISFSSNTPSGSIFEVHFPS